MIIRDTVTLVFIAFLVLSPISCGKAKEESAPPPQPKSNLPPQITSVKILPAVPKAGEGLKAIIETNDPEGDPITLHYRWYVNDQPLPTETGDNLGPQFFKKGDRVVVEVTPSDGKTSGNPSLSQPVYIGNTPPEIVSVRLAPTLVYPGDEIGVRLEGRDADGDALTYTYEWRRNGNIIPDETMETLNTRGFKKRDLVSVTVIPFDGADKGKPRRSLPIVIANRPPEITSFPPVDISDSRYTYVVKASDADGDPLTFSLEESPPGMTIDPATGTIHWDIPLEADLKPLPSHNVKVIVTDGDAKAFQSFSLILK